MAPSYLSSSGTPEALPQALTASALKTVSAFKNLSPKQWTFRYAPEKWTPGMILQHLIDTEHIFTYRALCFSRADKTVLPGFDENAYAKIYNQMDLEPEKTCHAFSVTRAATLQLFEACSPLMLGYSGIANNTQWTVNELGWAIVNHNVHHLQILQTQYLSKL